MAKKSSPIYDDEIISDEGFKIDLGKYIEILIRQWQWIAACTLGLGLLAFAYASLVNRLSPSYEAVALVASAQTESTVDFGSAITTNTDFQMALDSYYGYDTFRDMRFKSFISQVQNGAIAEQVLSQIGPILVNNKGKPITSADLTNYVSADLIPKTDTIQISATYRDPVIAAEIANAWGKAYVKWINDLYTMNSLSNPASETDITRARAAYEKAEADLENIISLDRTAAYTRQVEEITSIITHLRAALLLISRCRIIWTCSRRRMTSGAGLWRFWTVLFPCAMRLTLAENLQPSAMPSP